MKSKMTTLRILAAITLATATACWAAPTPESCATLKKHGKHTEAESCYETLSHSNDAYARAEGLWGTQQYEAANEAFRVAVTQSGSNPNYRVRWGLLLHDRFNNKDANGLFEEALKIDPKSAQAYLGLATVSADGFDSKAKEYAAKAIELDPKLADAHEFMANLALENMKTDVAVEEADKAIALSSEALEAYAVRAAVDVLADKSPDAWLAKIKAINPTYGEGYALIGYHLVLNRRYEDGVGYYRKAIEADPKLWPAHSQLGINLMRMGQFDEPVKELQLAYDNGQKDAATVNSLRLLDSYKNFVTVKDSTTILKFNKKEADLLQPYFQGEMRKITAAYDAKYKMKLPDPVQVEVYPDHEDFAVRTMGMPGLGALGVTFGEVVAMDSPSGRKPGDFNWGSTLWHEMSHVYILTMTHHRVPRWFAEGLAVHEEGEASPLWANRVTPDILVAIKEKKLLPVADIDRGFIFPEYPSQVIVSYWQAGGMCDYIKERWGADKLLAMAHAFGDLKTTPQVIQEQLGMKPEDFDAAYMAWMEQHIGDRAKNFDTWRAQLKALVAMAKAKQDDAVIKTAPDVIKLYPEYVGDANAYEFLAASQLAKSDKQAAAKTLADYMKEGGESPEALTKLASLQEELGHPKDAIATLNEVNFIYPMDEAQHHHLGQLNLAQKDSPAAIREFGAVVALKPVDKAGAHYELAQAYYDAGNRDKAEESVLDALEVAPGYKPAQKLLLEIKAAESGTKPN